MIVWILVRHVLIVAWRSLSCAAGIHQPHEKVNPAASRVWVCCWCHTMQMGGAA